VPIPVSQGDQDVECVPMKGQERLRGRRGWLCGPRGHDRQLYHKQL
jgi:hypothetical protein